MAVKKYLKGTGAFGAVTQKENTENSNESRKKDLWRDLR